MSQPEIAPPPRRRAASRTTAHGFGALAVLSLAHLVVDAYSSSYAPVLALLRQRLDLSFAEVGAGAAVFAFSSSIMQPAYGLLSDRLRSPIIIILAPGIAAIGLAAMPFSSSYAVAIAFLFIAGIGIASFHPQGVAQAADTLPNRPSVAMALFIAAGNVGFAMGPAIITATYALWGWQGMWRIGFPGMLCTLLLLPLAPAPIRHADGDRAGVGEALRARWRPLLTMYLFVVVRGMVQLLYVGFLALYLLDEGLTVAGAGTSLSVFLAAGSIGSLVGGMLGSRYGERTIIRLSMALSLPLFIGAFMVPGLIFRIALLSAAFFVLLWSNPLTVVLAQSWVPDHRGTVSSLLMGFAWGVGGLMAPVFGALADAYGLGPSLAVVGLLPLLGIVLAAAIPDEHSAGSLPAGC